MLDYANDEKAIFLAALEQSAACEREAYLRSACGDDPELLKRVKVLLSVHEESRGPLDAPSPGVGVAPTLDRPIAERPGMVIGPYKLLEQIGEGGFGVVFMAEQQQPIRRKVALKVLKPGMDTRQVVARFEAERQALALMDHPNKIGNSEEAVAWLKKAVDLETNDVSAHDSLAQGLAKLGRVDEALAMDRKAVELDSKNALKLTNLGVTLKAIKESEEEAVGCFQKAIEINPKIQLAWMVNKIRVRYAPRICFTIQASWMGSKGSGRSSV
ncbi:MAG TPA: hypothetical protein PK867_15305 [Pirellulales bacterium]|nr:hypothetical protein [Pirellulales bacterium]